MIRAHSVSVFCCEHGTVSIRFHDVDGQIVAIGSMPTTTAEAVSKDIADVIAAFNAGTPSGSCGVLH